MLLGNNSNGLEVNSRASFSGYGSPTKMISPEQIYVGVKGKEERIGELGGSRTDTSLSHSAGSVTAANISVNRPVK